MKNAKIKGIHLCWVIVSDLKKAKRFYGEILGLNMTTQDDTYGWLEFEAPEGSKLGVGLAQKEDTTVASGDNAIITITVDNIEAAKRELVEKGVKLLGDICEIPGHVKLQFFSDPDGNLFQLVETLSS